MITDPCTVLHLDLKTCTFEEVKGVPPTKFVFEIQEDGPVRVSGAFSQHTRLRSCSWAHEIG